MNNPFSGARRLESLKEVKIFRLYRYRESPDYDHGGLKEGDTVMVIGDAAEFRVGGNFGVAVVLLYRANDECFTRSGPFAVSHPEALETLY